MFFGLYCSRSLSSSVIDSDDDNMLVVPKGESDDETENTSNEAMFPL